MRWRVSKGGKAEGPYDEAQIIEWVQGGHTDLLLQSEAGGPWMKVSKSPFAGYAPAGANPDRGQPVSKMAAFSVVAAVALAAVMVVAVVLYLGDDTASTPTPQPEETHAKVAPVPPKPKPPTLAEKIAAAKDLPAALRLCKPTFADARDKLDPGAAVFALWCARHLKWSDMASLPKTHFGLVMKDSQPERGKRMCVRGSIMEIAVNRSAGVPIYEGEVMSPAANIYAFEAVGSTGNLVQHSPARFCGIVTGRYDYGNSAGGVTHAVRMVGMFDLPQNKQ